MDDGREKNDLSQARYLRLRVRLLLNQKDVKFRTGMSVLYTAGEEAEMLGKMVSLQFYINHIDGYFSGGAAQKLCGDHGVDMANKNLVTLWRVLVSIKRRQPFPKADNEDEDEYEDASDYVQMNLLSLTDTYCIRDPVDAPVIEADMYPYVKILYDFVRGPSGRVHQRWMDILGLKPEDMTLQGLVSKSTFTEEEIKAAEAIRKEEIPFMDTVKKGDPEPVYLKVLRMSCELEYRHCADKMEIGPTHKAYMKALCLFHCYEEAPEGLARLISTLRSRLLSLAPEAFRPQMA